MKACYIAGPYRAPTPYAVERNIRAAEAMILPVADLGLVPVVPHLMFRSHDGALPDAWFLAATLEIMRRCDAVLLLPTWQESSGAMAERNEAIRIGLPVFDSMDGLCLWAEEVAA